MTKDEFELRGKLATLKCWHRLTQEEVEDLLRFAAAQPEQEPFEPDWANFNEGRAVGWTEAIERIAEKVKEMPWENDTKNSFLIWLKEQR
jgi:hypothetical protein